MKEIKMIINNGHGMEDGSKDNIQIHLEQLLLSKFCETTKLGNFSSGETLTWKLEKLGNCKDVQFDTAKAAIDFQIMTDGNDDFCPASIEVIMRDEAKSSYFTEKMDCNYNKSKNYKKHIANKQ